jgi:hypothetical protein
LGGSGLITGRKEDEAAASFDLTAPSFTGCLNPRDNEKTRGGNRGGVGAAGVRWECRRLVGARV